jgi:hypothetical protein
VTVPVALLALLLTAALPENMIHGVVHDTMGLPVAQVNVYVAGSQLLTTTDKQGRFELQVAVPGEIRVVAFLHGYKPCEVEVGTDRSQALELVLQPGGVDETVTVTAPRPIETRLVPLDVVRTPGAQADLFQVLQGLAGVAKVDDGAGLFVQGGDTSEVLFLRDGVVIEHPYRYETSTGGQYGSVEPFLFEGISFSMAGFPARYGNALSAVLDLRGLSRPTTRQYYATLGLAGTSGQFALPLGNKGGLRLSGNRTFTQLLFAVNGSPRRFERYPSSWDLDGGAYFDSPTLGSFKVFGISQTDDVGVEVQKEEFSGFLNAASKQRVFSAAWEKTFGAGWRANASLGEDRYTQIADVGVLDLDFTDRQRSGRLAVSGDVAGVSLRLGIDADQRRSIIIGEAPRTGGDLGGTRGDTSTFNVHYDDWQQAGYLEAERRQGPFTATAGIRMDHFQKAGLWKGSPRLNLFIAAGPKQRVRLAWGQYNQAPSPEYYDATFGAPRLAPMEAQHWVAGYEYGAESDPLYVRAEAYHKRYSRLPLEVPGGGFTNEGYGTANGFDFFVRGRWRALDFRGAYSFLAARRRWTPVLDSGQYALPTGTWRPDFEIPHTLALVATYKLSSTWGMGATWRIASGKPFTPIQGGILGRTGYRPIYGAINSDRFPRYERLDASISYLTSAWRARMMLFTGVTNALARHNIFEYKYSPDFSQRQPVLNAAPRSFYVGLTIFG